MALKYRNLTLIGTSHIARQSINEVREAIENKEMIAIPKSRNESRIKENMEIFNFKLTDEEITKINKLNKDLRNCSPGFAEFDY